MCTVFACYFTGIPRRLLQCILHITHARPIIQFEPIRPPIKPPFHPPQKSKHTALLGIALKEAVDRKEGKARPKIPLHNPKAFTLEGLKGGSASSSSSSSSK